MKLLFGINILFYLYVLPLAMLLKILIFFILSIYVYKIERPKVFSSNKQFSAMAFAFIFPMIIFNSGIFQTLLRDKIKAECIGRRRLLKFRINKDVTVHVEVFENDKEPAREGYLKEIFLYFLNKIFLGRNMVVMNKLNYKQSNINGKAKNIVLMHGMHGNSLCNYIINTANIFLRRNCRVFCLNARGLGGSILKNTDFTHIGHTDDFYTLCDYINEKYGGKIFMIGFSQGGNAISKFMSEIKNSRKKCKFEKIKEKVDLTEINVIQTNKDHNLFKSISGGMSICNPFDFKKAEIVVSKQKFIGQIIIKAVYEAFFDHLRYVMRDWEHLDKVFVTRNCYDANEVLCKYKALKYETVEEYLRENASVHSIKNISKPFLFINTDDDPLIPLEVVPREEIYKNSNTGLVIVQGGHLGFKSITLGYTLTNIIEKFYDEIN